MIRINSHTFSENAILEYSATPILRTNKGVNLPLMTIRDTDCLQAYNDVYMDKPNELIAGDMCVSVTVLKKFLVQELGGQKLVLLIA